MRRISSLLLRALWSRTPSTLPAEYSQRLELLASPPFYLGTSLVDTER